MARNVSAARLQSLLGSSLDRSPAYLALADGLRLLISDGRVTAGTRLPSERELTSQLGLSRTTVTRAYAELRDRGYLSSRQGSGSVVRLPAAVGGSRDTLLSPTDAPEGSIDLTCAASAAPPGVAAAYEAAVAQLPTFLGGAGYFPSGVPALKEAIARRYCERGLPTSPDQVVVTGGALAATAVVVRALTRAGDRVLVESPSYPNVLTTMARSGVRVAGAGVDPGGWDIDTVKAALRQVSPAAAYLIPDFQNPTGQLMPEGQRAELGAALTRARTVAIVDETLVEMAVDDVAMPPPMATFAADSISVGSASKAFWGGLRIGWVRAPKERVGALVSSRLSFDLGAPLLEQLVLTALLQEREAVLTHRREQLRASRTALVDALAEHLPDWRFQLPPGGLALWCELPDALSSALTTAAERHGLLLAAGPSFAAEGGLERFLRLPYTQQPEVLTEAVRRLAQAWQDAQRHRGSARGRSPLVA
jgi:DNA-binding transcriptional MocR family regulator